MTLVQLSEFFKWMTIINLGFYLLSAVLTLVLRPLIYRWHGRLFGLSEETIAAIAYGWLGVYKILLILFCLVPYLALLLMA